MTPGSFERHNPGERVRRIPRVRVDSTAGCHLLHRVARQRRPNSTSFAPGSTAGPARADHAADSEAATRYLISPDGRCAFHTLFRLRYPAAVDLVQPARSHGHPDAGARTSGCATQSRDSSVDALEFFKVDVGRRAPARRLVMKPPGFDPTKQYPVLIHVYGEPAGQTVLDRWGGEEYLWHLMLAQQGYIVASVDNRGTPAPRGRAWRKAIYKKIGMVNSGRTGRRGARHAAGGRGWIRRESASGAGAAAARLR